MRSIITTLLLLSCYSFLNAQNTVIPAELKSFVPKGYETLDFVKEDMNGDKLTDYLLVLKVVGEDTLTYENENWEAARPFLLIIRQPNGSLKEAVRNDELIYCKQCGGSMGDPYQGIETKPKQFTVDFYGGSSLRWTEAYTFRYDSLKKDWFFQNHHSSYFQSGDVEKTMDESTVMRSEIGEITLRNFTPDYNADTSHWKVSVAKTFFYSSPSLQAKPKKTYLVKGDVVNSLKQFKNFIQCVFTNSKDQTSYGFILKKDLVLLKPGTIKATR